MLVLSRTSPAVEVIEVTDEVLGGFMGRHMPGLDMGVDLTLALLPALGPEPPLVGWDRQSSSEFEHPVLAFGHLQLCTGLVQVQPSAYISGQGYRAAPLDAEETRRGRCAHTKSVDAEPQDDNTAKRSSSYR
jgi:hypothetical protein